MVMKHMAKTTSKTNMNGSTLIIQDQIFAVDVWRNIRALCTLTTTMTGKPHGSPDMNANLKKKHIHKS